MTHWQKLRVSASHRPWWNAAWIYAAGAYRALACHFGSHDTITGNTGRIWCGACGARLVDHPRHDPNQPHQRGKGEFGDGWKDRRLGRD